MANILSTDKKIAVIGAFRLVVSLITAVRAAILQEFRNNASAEA